MQSKNSRSSERQKTGDPKLDAKVAELLEAAGVAQDTEYYTELMVNVLRLAKDQPSLGDLKLFTRAFRELRVANRVFAPYRHVRKLSIFGSARSKPDSPSCNAARAYAKAMSESGYMVITGAGDGVMGAAQEGAGRERSFGLNIRLPFEQSANDVILRDAKLLTFKYFFTRKVNFVKESHAFACFPGGFGTMDEAFEVLTLLQTGKARIVPLVLVDPKGGNFWKTFVRYLKEHLLNDGLVSAEDFHLLKVTDSLEEAQHEVFHFYANFHSYRFVDEMLVLRMQRAIPSKEVDKIEKEFADICVGGKLDSCLALPKEINEPEIAHLPRLCVPFNRRNFGRLRQMIDRINDF